MSHHNKPAPSKRRRVMIIEDGARFRKMLTLAVREMEFVPRPVDCAESAIASLEEEPVEIAMVDLGLPGMSGLDLCRYLREHFPLIQIIILTGYGDLDAAKQAIRLDVVDFLTKPCDHNELEMALDHALRRSTPTHAELSDQSGWAREGTTPIRNDNGVDTDACDGAERTIEQLERQHILDAIKRNNGNRAAAANELGISVRTLYYRLSRYKMLDRFETDRQR